MNSVKDKAFTLANAYKDMTDYHKKRFDILKKVVIDLSHSTNKDEKIPASAVDKILKDYAFLTVSEQFRNKFNYDRKNGASEASLENSYLNYKGYLNGIKVIPDVDPKYFEIVDKKYRQAINKEINKK